MVPFESTLERDWIYTLDFDPTLQSLHSQPFTVDYYSVDGYRRTYTPDFHAAFEPCPSVFFTQYVYEIKYREDLRENWVAYRPKFKAAIHYCRDYGIKFKIMTENEIRTPYLTNATFLRRYREYPADVAIETVLIRTSRMLKPEDCTPRNILLAAYASETNRMKAVGFLWRLVENRVFSFDYFKPLTMNTPLSLLED